MISLIVKTMYIALSFLSPFSSPFSFFSFLSLLSQPKLSFIIKHIYIFIFSRLLFMSLKTELHLALFFFSSGKGWTAPWPSFGSPFLQHTAGVALPLASLAATLGCLGSSWPTEVAAAGVVTPLLRLCFHEPAAAGAARDPSCQQLHSASSRAMVQQQSPLPFAPFGWQHTAATLLLCSSRLQQQLGGVAAVGPLIGQGIHALHIPHPRRLPASPKADREAPLHLSARQQNSAATHQQIAKAIRPWLLQHTNFAFSHSFHQLSLLT